MPKLRLYQSLGHVFDPRRANSDLRRAGDRARDSQRWDEAAACYADFLKRHPDDVGIRVQLGNCLKEAGHFIDALKAYDAAIALDAGQADPHLQRGHLLKVMGRKSEALTEYRKSFALNSQSNPAFEELLALGAPADLSATGSDATGAQGATIYVDITDLIDYLRVNVSLSGIQRVVANLITHAPAFAAGRGGSPVRPVIPDYNGSTVFTVKMSLLEGLIGLVIRGRSDRERLDSALNALLDSRSQTKLNVGDTLLIPGAFWIYQRYDLLNLLRQNGVRVTVFIHDLIQITNPEFVEPAATAVFSRSIVDVLCVCSYILTNSQFVADEVHRFVSERMNFKLPITSVPLATELGSEKLDLSSVDQQYVDLTKEEYVLCVGTIEIRKNHMYLVNVWERLIQRFNGPLPNLVFVGKWGWEIAPLQKYLAMSDYLGGRLYIYNAISDAELAFMYQNCLFTVYPSFAEGWGLPVGESLWYGKPCIASKVTAIPEVGGTLCKYINPFDEEDGYRVISSVLADRSALSAWTAQIKTQFNPKTWKSFSEELFQTIQRYQQDGLLDGVGNNLILENGEIATFGNDPLEQLYAKQRRLITARMSRMTGWHGLEPWGCWAAKRKAVLKVNTRMLRGTDAVVYLHLKTPDCDSSADCTIKVNQTATFVDELGPVPVWCAATGQVGDRGVIEIVIVSGKGYSHRWGRELYVGILGIAIVPADDDVMRTKFLESIVRSGIPLKRPQ